jgi:hypothetical protein
MSTKLWSENLRGLGTVGRIILEYILEKQDQWWGSYEHSNEPSC